MIPLGPIFQAVGAVPDWSRRCGADHESECAAGHVPSRTAGTVSSNIPGGAADRSVLSVSDRQDGAADACAKAAPPLGAEGRSGSWTGFSACRCISCGSARIHHGRAWHYAVHAAAFSPSRCPPSKDRRFRRCACRTGERAVREDAGRFLSAPLAAFAVLRQSTDAEYHVPRAAAAHRRLDCCD